MADLAKLAMGRKGFQKGVGKGDPLKVGKGGPKTVPPSKPAKTLEEASTEEIGELEAAFRDRLAKEDKRRKQATDSETWFAVYFDSREAKERFLRKHGLLAIGDKYLPGRAVDRVLSRNVPVRDGHRKER